MSDYSLMYAKFTWTDVDVGEDVHWKRVKLVCLEELYKELRGLYLWMHECGNLTEELIENDKMATYQFDAIIKRADPAEV